MMPSHVIIRFESHFSKCSSKNVVAPKTLILILTNSCQHCYTTVLHSFYDDYPFKCFITDEATFKVAWMEFSGVISSFFWRRKLQIADIALHELLVAEKMNLFTIFANPRKTRERLKKLKSKGEIKSYQNSSLVPMDL